MSKTSPYGIQRLDEGNPYLGSSHDPYSLPHRTYLLTQEELSQLFRVSVRTVQRWTRLNLIPSVKIGGVTRYDIDEVRRSLGNGDEFLTGLVIVR